LCFLLWGLDYTRTRGVEIFVFIEKKLTSSGHDGNPPKRLACDGWSTSVLFHWQMHLGNHTLCVLEKKNLPSLVPPFTDDSSRLSRIAPASDGDIAT
jgi:hypothetical protein